MATQPTLRPGPSVRTGMLAASVAIAVTMCAMAVAAQRQVPVAAKRDDPAIAGFLDRVNAYLALHQRLESTTPKLPDGATPKQIDDRQRALAALIQAARAEEAKRGDVFTPRMAAFAKDLLNRVFAGPDGQQLLSSIMDENPVDIQLKINQRYPSDVPFATMPPDVLRALPELPEELEYRFIGDDLILLDPHAHIIVDFIPDALPGR